MTISIDANRPCRDHLSAVLESACKQPNVQALLRQHGLQNAHVRLALALEARQTKLKRRGAFRDDLRDLLSMRDVDFGRREDAGWLEALSDRDISIVELHLDPFRSYAEGTTLRFDQPCTHFIMAPNGHGKTTIVQALRFLFRGPRANKLNATRKEQNAYKWDCIPVDQRGSAAPISKVTGLFVVDGHRIEVTRTVQRKRMYPDDGSDLICNLVVEIDDVRANEPESALEKWFGRSVLLDYHVFDAEDSRKRFIGHVEEGNGAGIYRFDEGSQSVQTCLQEFIGLDVVSALILDLRKMIREVVKEIDDETKTNADWIEYRSLLAFEEKMEEAARSDLEGCQSELQSLITDSATLVERLGEAEAAVELFAQDEILSKQRNSLSEERESLETRLTEIAPWLHIILAHQHLRTIGERNSGTEARHIINQILEHAPLNGAEDVRQWLLNLRDEQVGPPGASELVGTSGWGNISQSLDHATSLRVSNVRSRLQNLNERVAELAKAQLKLDDAWSKLPELKDGAKDELAELGKRKVELERNTGTLEERERQLKRVLEDAQFKLRELSMLAPSGEDDDEQLQALVNESDRLKDMLFVMQTFQTEVTAALREMVEQSASALFQQIMRKDGIGLVLDDSYRFHMLDQASGQEHPLPSAGEETIAVLAFLSSLQQVTGLHLPFVIDSSLHRLDCIHQSRILQHFAEIDRQAVVFLTEKDWESFSPADVEVVLGQKLIALHPPGTAPRIEELASEADVNQFMDEYSREEE